MYVSISNAAKSFLGNALWGVRRLLGPFCHLAAPLMGCALRVWYSPGPSKHTVSGLLPDACSCREAIAKRCSRHQRHQPLSWLHPYKKLDIPGRSCRVVCTSGTPPRGPTLRSSDSAIRWRRGLSSIPSCKICTRDLRFVKGQVREM